MIKVVNIPSSLDSLLGQISSKFDQTEAADVIHELRTLYPTKQDSFDQNDLYGAFKQLYVLGDVDQDGDQKVLEILSRKASKKDDIFNLINIYKKESSPRKDDFVGRDADVSNIIQLVTNPRVPGINLFGESGVGKTTLAKEVSKRMESSSFHKMSIDVREISNLDNVYFNILQALHLPSWGDNKKERIYKHLMEDLSTKTVLILDSVEQLLSRENKQEQETRADFLEFLEVVITSEACKKGYLKLILTSTTQLNESALKRKWFTEYNVQPFKNDVSKDFISKRSKSNFSDVHLQDKAVSEVAELCRNNAYILQGAQQLMREGFSSPTDVLRKITAQIVKGVPNEFACISAVFESLPNDHLRQVAVKISLLRRPFSVSTAMKITEISSDDDAELDLEMLVVHRIITAEDVNGKRKYDLHALFRDFVTLHLCKVEDHVYKEQLKRGEKLFFEHFSGKLTKLANKLENEFVNTYSKLEENRANFELAIHLSEENKETFDLLLHTDDHNQLALMGILFEVLKDVTERRQLFGKWAEAAEDQGQWSTSAVMRCWQSIQGCHLEGTLNEEILAMAKTSIQKLRSSNPHHEKLNEVESLFLHCQGKIKWMKANKLVQEQRTRKDGKKLLKEGIEHLKESVELKGDSTVTSRALNLIGNCYMDLEDPIKAKEYYQQALDMKIRLVGSEKHLEIPTYYNQMAQVHDRIGREEEEKWYNRLFGFKESARKEYIKAVEWTEKALALQEELGVSNTDYTATFQRNLAITFIGLEDYEKALEYAQKAFEIRNKCLGKHPETVRILYLIGVIHEDRKDLQAALQSYEEAFEMEESLPDDNHSVVRKILCDRLDEICKKLEHSFLRNGLFLYFPPKAVPKRTTVRYKVLPNDYSPSPADTEETLVSNIVELSPNDLVIHQPIIVGLMHSGPGKDVGYETVVKAFNKGKNQWEELKEMKDKSHLPEDCKRDFIQVQIKKLTILGAVTRLITDRFQVTPKGCVVRSSVCHDVTVEFPEGAVDKTLEGIMKLLPIPYDIHDLFNVYACPMLSLEGFENVEFLKSVTIQMPHPCPEKYSTDQVRLVRLENNGWQEVKDPKIDVEDAYIKLQVQHFCWLLLIIPIGGTAVAVASALVFEYLRQTPQEAFIAASRDIIQRPLQMNLHCLPSHRRKELDNERLLGGSTVEKPLRPGEKAFTKIKGRLQMTDSDTYVTFLENQREFVKILNLQPRKIGNAETQEQSIRLVFYKKENEDPPLCEFSIEEKLLGNAPCTMRPCHDVREIPNLNDEQKRWIVVGVCLNKTLLPALRDFLKQEMEKHYNELKAKHRIENQTHTKHLKKDGKHKLSYKSINKNKTKKKPRLFDYNVKSAEDLGKLYLMPYMAKFTVFDDACDMSAVLGILSSATVFSAKVQELAKEVKNNVRNPWGHCNFKEWTDAKFSSCCQLMQSLVQALKLHDEHEKRIIDELGAWETKGVGADSVAEFIEFAEVEIERLSEEGKRLEANQKEQEEQIAAALHEHLEANQEEEDEERALLLHERFDEDQKSDDEEAVNLQQRLEARQKEDDKRLVATFVHIIETLFKDNKHRDEKIDALGFRVAALEQSKESSDKKIEVLEKGQEVLAKKQEIVEQKLKDITSSTDEEPVECFGILITNGNFQDIPEDIIQHMIKYIDDDIPGKENGQWKPEKFLRRFPSRSIDVPRSDCLQILLECLEANYLKAMSHMIELLSVGQVIVHTPLKENQELTEETIEIVSSNLNCSWEDMAGHLKVPQEIVKRCKEEDSVDTHKVTTRKMVRQWIEGVNDSCTLEVVFDALRLCRDRNTGEHLAVYTTKYIRKIIAQP